MNDTPASEPPEIRGDVPATPMNAEGAKVAPPSYGHFCDRTMDNGTGEGGGDNAREPDVAANETPSIRPIGEVDYNDQSNLLHHAPLDKFRYQGPIVSLVVLAVQLSYIWLFIGLPFSDARVTSSIATTLIANGVSMMYYRQLRLFPGARRMAFLIPAFLPAYAMAALVLLWLRQPYSVTLLVIGAVLGMTLVGAFNLINRGVRSRSLLLIPSKRVTRLLHELPGMNHRVCTDPSDITQNRATIVADLHQDMSPEWERAIAHAALQGSTIYHIRHIRESMTGKVRIDHLSENSFGTLRPNEFYAFFKGMFERIASLLALVLLSPLIVLAAIAIRIDSPGSPIFKQARTGFRGKPFTIYKLRTMVRTKIGHQTQRSDEITQANDPRITAVGRFLRRTRIDELPQLWNVARGELSLIGPRPEAARLSQWYNQQLDFYDYRHIIRPGITGWAQVNQGHVTDPHDVHDKLQYDFYYIKHYSLWLDVLILVKTIGIMFSGRGAR